MYIKRVELPIELADKCDEVFAHKTVLNALFKELLDQERKLVKEDSKMWKEIYEFLRTELGEDFTHEKILEKEVYICYDMIERVIYLRDKNQQGIRS